MVLHVSHIGPDGPFLAKNGPDLFFITSALSALILPSKEALKDSHLLLSALIVLYEEALEDPHLLPHVLHLGPENPHPAM